MRKLLLIISTILSFSFFSYSQKIGIKVDKTLSENVEKLKTNVLELLTEYKKLN